MLASAQKDGGPADVSPTYKSPPSPESTDGPLLTRNPSDFAGIESLVTITAL